MTRVNTWPNGALYLDPAGPYELPFPSALLHRFAVVDSHLEDTYGGAGVTDDMVRERDRTSPRPVPAPVAPPEAPAGPPSLAEQFAQLQAVVELLLLDTLEA